MLVQDCFHHCLAYGKKRPRLAKVVRRRTSWEAQGGGEPRNGVSLGPSFVLSIRPAKSARRLQSDVLACGFQTMACGRLAEMKRLFVPLAEEGLQNAP
jgi:hypothetical protein